MAEAMFSLHPDGYAPHFPVDELVVRLARLRQEMQYEKFHFWSSHQKDGGGEISRLTDTGIDFILGRHDAEVVKELNIILTRTDYLVEILWSFDNRSHRRGLWFAVRKREGFVHVPVSETARFVFPGVFYRDTPRGKICFQSGDHAWPWPLIFPMYCEHLVGLKELLTPDAENPLTQALRSEKEKIRSHASAEILPRLKTTYRNLAEATIDLIIAREELYPVW